MKARHAVLRGLPRPLPRASTLAGGAPRRTSLALWSGLGYYHRARNLHRGARHVRRPARRTLPARARGGARRPRCRPLHGQRRPLDRVRRAAAGGGRQRAARARPPVRPCAGPKWRADAAYYNRAAGRCSTASAPGDWNQAVMELGATVCTPRRPACPACPLARGLPGARAGHRRASCRKDAPRRATWPVTVAAALVESAGTRPAGSPQRGAPHGPHVGGSPDVAGGARPAGPVAASCASGTASTWCRPARGAGAPRDHVPAHPRRGLRGAAGGASRPVDPERLRLGTALTRSATLPVVVAHPQGRARSDARRSFRWNSSETHAPNHPRTVLLLAAAGAAGAWAVTHWPRINDVETGRTPEYPDLKARDYMTPRGRRWRSAVKAAVERPCGWHVRRAGPGPRGRGDPGRARPAPWRLQDEVTIRVRRQGGSTRVERALAVAAASSSTSARTPATSRSLLPWTGSAARRVPGAGGREACRLGDRACLFCEIVAGRIPARVAYQDDDVLAFHDINPQGPVHILMIPKRHITSLLDLDAGRRRSRRQPGPHRPATSPTRRGSRSAASAWSSTAATTRATASTTSTCTSWAAASSAGLRRVGGRNP